MFTGSIPEIDSTIAQWQHLLSIFPRSDPRRFEPIIALALLQAQRYTLSNQREDLDTAIVNFAESILLSPLSRGPSILEELFLLAYALLLRSEVSRQPEDAICATKYLSHLRDQPHEIPRIPRDKVTTLLVDAVALQVKLVARNLILADAPGEFMIISGSGRFRACFRARPVRSVLTHCLQDLPTK